VILSHNSALSTLDGILPCDGPRPVSLSRHHDENHVPTRPEGRRATPFVSHSYKCPLPQLLSFDNLTNARGYGGLPTFQFSNALSASRTHLRDAQRSTALPFFSTTCALFCSLGEGGYLPSAACPDSVLGGHSHSAQHQCYHAEETYY
jgi:hypothetical protein